jgi:hypothetical protein
VRTEPLPSRYRAANDALLAVALVDGSSKPGATRGCLPSWCAAKSQSERLGPHLDGQGEAPATERATGTVYLAEEDHDVVRVRSRRL